MAVVLNKRSGRTDGIYVGRPTKWGNPFRVGNEYAQDEAAAAYKPYLWANADLLEALPELFGHNLICWCAPKACHAHALLQAAAWAESNPQALAARIDTLRGQS